jgi:hypothetical protein
MLRHLARWLAWQIGEYETVGQACEAEARITVFSTTDGA